MIPTPEATFGSGRSPINRKIVSHTANAAYTTSIRNYKYTNIQADRRLDLRA